MAFRFPWAIELIEPISACMRCMLELPILRETAIVDLQSDVPCHTLREIVAIFFANLPSCGRIELSNLLCTAFSLVVCPAVSAALTSGGKCKLRSTQIPRQLQVRVIQQNFSWNNFCGNECNKCNKIIMNAYMLMRLFINEILC